MRALPCENHFRALRQLSIPWRRQHSPDGSVSARYNAYSRQPGAWIAFVGVAPAIAPTRSSLRGCSLMRDHLPHCADIVMHERLPHT